MPEIAFMCFLFFETDGGNVLIPVHYIERVETTGNQTRSRILFKDNGQYLVVNNSVTEIRNKLNDCKAIEVQ